jgi:hypothetical protein
MRSTKFLLFGLVFITLITGACSTLPRINNRIDGSGNLISEERNVSGFNRISLSGFGQVEITQGTTESLTVTTDDNIMPYIRTEVNGNTLVLGFTDAGRRRSFNPSDKIKFNLVIKELDRIDISGAGDLHADKLVVDSLRIDLSGAGSLEFDSLTADELVTELSGAGSVIVAGKVKGQELDHSGVGTYYAADLESETAIFNVSGAGSATVWVKETLNVNVSGLGNIIYYGSPRVIQNISGLGKLIGEGEK